MLRPLLGLALTSLIAACQPLVPAAPAPVQATTEARFLSLPEAYTEQGALPRETDVLLLGSADALEVPLQYDRGVVETLVWKGGGTGLAELYNRHGQLLYRVEEGAPAQTVTVGAGRHTLKLSGASSKVLSLAEPDGEAGWRRHFEQVDAISKRTEPSSHRGPIFGGGPAWPINDRCRAIRPLYEAERLPWRELSEDLVQEVLISPCLAR